jgi:hypothetical protein
MRTRDQLLDVSGGPIPAKWQAWRVPYYVKGLALGIPLYLVAIHLWTWILFVPGSLTKGGYDFRQSYTAAYMLRTGHGRELYDYEAQKTFQDELVSRKPVALPFVAPAYEALLLEPLSLVSFRTAYVLFALLNLAVLSICFVLLRPWMSNLGSVFRWLPVTLFLGFLPVAIALIDGQDAIILTTLLAAAFALLTKQRQLWAGVLTGLAFFKFPIVLPIALLFLVWRHWRLVWGFGISAASVILLSVWLTGIQQTRLYVGALMSIAGLTRPTTPLAVYPVNWRMMANVHGLLTGLLRGSMPDSWLHVLTIVVSAGVLAYTTIAGRRIHDAYRRFLLAITCSVLVGHHTYMYDLSVLLIPVIALLNTYLPAESAGTKRQRMIGRCAVLMFVAPVVEAFSQDHFYIVALAVFPLLVAIGQTRSEDFYPQAVGLSRHESLDVPPCINTSGEAVC